MEQPAWKHNVVFPMIARVIREASDDKGGYISAHSVATRMSQDPEAQVVIEEAEGLGADRQSAGGLATNMVAWFSAKMTAGQSEWASAFQRVMVDGEWAYRPQGWDEPVLREPRRDGSIRELQNVIAEFPTALDDRSAEFVAILRDAGLLGDKDWAWIVEELRQELGSLARRSEMVAADPIVTHTASPDAGGNADWMKSVGACRLAGHQLPLLSSFWLWRVGHVRGDTFWWKIRRAAKGFGCEPFPPVATSQ